VKISLDQFDKAFENRIRLQIMSVLVANESYDFNSLKELLDLTDGNLASHLKALEKGRIHPGAKNFHRPQTQYPLPGIRKRSGCFQAAPACPRKFNQTTKTIIFFIHLL
jgi:hypothetical protein